MGIRCSSELRRGQRYITMKLLLLTIFVAVAMAEEAAKVAAPLPSRQFIWPASTGVKDNGIGFSSTCYGCFERRKRSAEADPGLVLPHPFGFYGLPYVYAKPVDLTLAGKDEGVAAHPEGATAWTQRSVILRRRRSAEAEPAAKPGLLYYGLPYYHVPIVPVVPVIKGDGIAAHPNGATAFRGTTTYGYQ